MLVVGLANGLRAVPTLGFAILLYIMFSSVITTNFAIPGVVDRGGLSVFVPVMIVLVLLALPPILTSTYAGVQNVDPAARDAARGMGMTGTEVVRKVEFPCALPLIMSGLRSATLQVIATVTVAGFLPFLGGLGRYIKDGTETLFDPQTGYPAMVAAGITVAVLARARRRAAQPRPALRRLARAVRTGEPRSRPEQADAPSDAAAEAHLTHA